MMGDYVEQTLECIKRLEAHINQEPGTTSDEYLEGSYLCRRFLAQLGQMKRILEYGLHEPTRLEGHRAVHRELHRAMMQTETSVKEWCIPGQHNEERALGKRREHCRETFLAARWWTMVTLWQAGHGYRHLGQLPFNVAVLRPGEKCFYGDVPFMERKGELQVDSQSRPISSYERQLSSVGLEAWLDQLLQWEVEFDNILGKDESIANMALEAIRRADYRVVVTENMPAIYVAEAKSPLIEEEVTLDLTRDVLGVSRTGAWVIRTKCQGVDCALKRVTDGDNEPVLARLSHPHIVQLIHYWRKDEYMFLVMELMEGDLTDLLSRHKRANDTLLSVSVAVDIMLQTAKGMLYLHDLGIAYPHLSCSNVLFRESGVSQDGDTRPSIPEAIPQVLRFCISSCFESNVQFGFAQVVTLLLLAQVQVLKSQENEVFLSFGTCEDLDLVQLNQQYSETPSASDVDLQKYPVHQLYPEPDVAGSDFNPSATLIFFHGFAKSSDEWKSTWMTRNREHVWPKAWLPKDLPGNVRILSLSYDIDAPGESPDIGAIEIGKNALRQLVLSSKWKLADPKARVILIGHSFGGLVIKSLVVEAHNLAFVSGKAKTEEQLVLKCPSFLENLEGIVFYSVPGSASQDQQFEEYIVKLNQTGLLQRSSLMQALLKDTRLFNQQMISLCSQFEEIVPEKTQILGFIEGKGMRRIREKQVVVSDASARAQMKKAELNIVEEDNHFEVCRPVSADHKGYKILVDFLKDKLKIDTFQMVEGDVSDMFPLAGSFSLGEFFQSENVSTANQQAVPTSNLEDIPKSNPQDVPTGDQRLPPGFRFNPSDVELVGYYLKEKINGRPIEMNPIAVVDLYKWEPWDLPDMSVFGGHNDQEWYFYSAWDKTYLNGSPTKFRANEYGYWISSGRDSIVRSARSSGFKRRLVYYRGRFPCGERTDWVMHEFRMEDKVYENLAGRQRAYILARVFEKGAAAPVVEKAYIPPLHVEEGMFIQEDGIHVEPNFVEHSFEQDLNDVPGLFAEPSENNAWDWPFDIEELIDSDWPDQKANVPKMSSIDAKVGKQGQSMEVTRVFQRRKKIEKESEGKMLGQKRKAGAEAGDESPENNAENSESPERGTMSPETRAALAGALKEIFVRHHVCCMEIIVQSLQEMAIKRTVANTDPEATAVAVAAAEALNAPAVELIGAVNKVATRLGGVYILTSLGDPVRDPLDVVIGLLRKMGPHYGLGITEIMSAFKIATGSRYAPRTTYQKVMKELCYARGAHWILKLGEG